MLNKFRFPARKPSSPSSASNLAGVDQASSGEPHARDGVMTSSASLGQLPDVENVPPPLEAPPPRSASTELVPDSAKASNGITPAPQASSAAPKKTRRKSYGGIRAMLGKNRVDSVSSAEIPPVPLVHAPQPQSQPQPQPLPPSVTTPTPTIVESASAPSIHPRSPKGKQLYLSGTESRSQGSISGNAATTTDAQAFPATSSQTSPKLPPIAEPRPSTSSLKPGFPFLGGMRRKSSHSNVTKSNEDGHKRPPSPSFLFGGGPKASCQRLPSYSSKKAQSVDDLSQFGAVPDLSAGRDAGPPPGKRPAHRGPRRSVELERGKAAGSGVAGALKDLHGSLDRIGEMAGTLAGMPSPTGDRHPRLSNPKGLRTVYGVPLQDLFWRDGEDFPLLFGTLVGLVEEHGIAQQGIYRIPGEKKVIEEVQVAVDERGVRGFNIWKASLRDVHNVTGAIKLWLREVPDGVVPFSHYDDFIDVSGIADEEAKTLRLRELVAALPEPNRVLLRRIVQHFGTVVDHAADNNMFAHNLAIVFAPSLFRSGSEQSNPLLSMQNIGRASVIVRHLIVQSAAVFSPPPSPPAPLDPDHVAGANNVDDDDGLSSSAKGDEDSTGSTAATSNAPLSDGAKSSTTTTRKAPTQQAEDDDSAVERLATPMDEIDEDQIGMAS